MNLPRELLDEIFSYLPSYDSRPLRACSLVARSWVSPARRRLFSSVTFTKKNRRSWKDRIPPSNTELLNHVRSLRFFTHWDIKNQDRLPINDIFDYLPSFHRLKHLTLYNMRIWSDVSERLDVPSAFRHTLSSLVFDDVVLTWFAFITIVDYLPGIADLVVVRPTWEIDHRHTPPLSRPLPGRLSVNVYRDFQTFPDKLSELEVEYDELLIHGSCDPIPATPHYQRIIDSCRKSLRRLRLSPRACTLQYVRGHAPGIN